MASPLPSSKNGHNAMKKQIIFQRANLRRKRLKILKSMDNDKHCVLMASPLHSSKNGHNALVQ